jgi:very-short-patch-repair endonuclease
MSRKPESIARAKSYRRELTGAEQKLWTVLRDRRFREIKFRRQHPIGPYVVDFACVAARLVIEVDGPSHDDAAQIAFDAERTRFLEHAGWRVLRISNGLIYEDRNGALQIIEAALFPSPPRGGEKVARRAG